MPLPHKLRLAAAVVCITAPLILVLSVSGQTGNQLHRGYYTDPALHGDTLIFTSEGDLWSVSAQGGAARRLTSGSGSETAAKLSPDGQTIAFQGHYEGPAEVYTMPITGGMPQRRTWDGDAAPEGWSPDGRLIVNTERYSTLPDNQLILLGSHGEHEAVPLATASEAAYSLRWHDPLLHPLHAAVERDQALQGWMGGEPLAL